jgi:hypothetical protein
MEKKTKIKVKVGCRAYRNGQNDYAGMTGVLTINTLENQLRVQFDEVGNNEQLSNFDLNKCNFY